MKQMVSLAAALALFAGCMADGDAEDGENDSVPTDGKADGGYSNAEIAGALHVANEVSSKTLDDDVGLSSRAVANIDAARAVKKFQTLAELDAVPYVGPVAIGKLIDYARTRGWVAESVLPEFVRLRGSLSEKDNSFGVALAVDGTTFVASAPAQGRGALYVYDLGPTGWRETQMVTPHGEVDGLGYNVALSGTTLAAYAHHVDDAGHVHRSVQIFVRTAAGFTYQASLEGDVDDTYFANVLAASGDRIAVGDPTHNAVRIYKRTNGVWSLEAPVAVTASWYHLGIALTDTTLAAATGTATQLFTRSGTTWSASEIPGCADSVAIDGALLVTGCVSDAGVEHLDHSGSVTVYEKTGTWQKQATLYPATPMRLGTFGASVSIRGERIAVGAPTEGELQNVYPYTNQSGAAYVFDRTGSTWTQIERRTQLVPVHHSSFGRAVHVDGDTLIVTAPGEGEWVRTASQNDEWQILGAVYAN